jgi:type I restriction enzyme, S subunit
MIREPLSNLLVDVEQCNPRDSGRSRITYLDISSVDNATKRLLYPQCTTVDAAPSRARQIVQTNDVLVSTVRPNLNAVALVPEEYDKEIASTGFCVLRPQPKQLCAKYLFYFTQSATFVRHLTTIANGAAYPAVTENDILETLIPLPDLTEQRRIAERLEQADRLRRTRRFALELTDTVLPAAFLEVFGDPTTNPLGLPVAELGDYLSFVTSGSRGWADYYAPKGARFIRSLDVRMNSISDEDAVFVIPPNGAEADRTRVAPGDVLLTITGSRIGRVAPVPEPLNGAFISQHVAILRLKAGLLPEFLSVFLSLDAGGQRQIARAQYGQTKPGLNLDQIREMRIPLPDLRHQQRFLEMAKRIDQLRAMQREALHQAEHLFASLLGCPFSD